MNAEIIKAMNRKNEKHPVHDWWRKNSYKIMRVVLWPVWLGTIAHNKIKSKLNARIEWNENRANDILNYYVPRKCSWDEETQELYFFDNGYGWYINHAKKYLKRKDRRFWKKFNYKIRGYLLNAFELEGFTKELDRCDGGWTEIYFKKIKEGD